MTTFISSTTFAIFFGGLFLTSASALVLNNANDNHFEKIPNKGENEFFDKFGKNTLDEFDKGSFAGYILNGMRSYSAIPKISEYAIRPTSSRPVLQQTASEPIHVTIRTSLPAKTHSEKKSPSHSNLSDAFLDVVSGTLGVLENTIASLQNSGHKNEHGRGHGKGKGQGQGKGSKKQRKRNGRSRKGFHGKKQKGQRK